MPYGPCTKSGLGRSVYVTLSPDQSGRRVWGGGAIYAVLAPPQILRSSRCHRDSLRMTVCASRAIRSPAFKDPFCALVYEFRRRRQSGDQGTVTARRLSKVSGRESRARQIIGQRAWFRLCGILTCGMRNGCSAGRTTETPALRGWCVPALQGGSPASGTPRPPSSRTGATCSRS